MLTLSLTNILFAAFAVTVASYFLVGLAEKAGINTVKYFHLGDNFFVAFDLKAWALPIAVNTDFGVRVQFLCFVFDWEF